jgi:hypothetical protein
VEDRRAAALMNVGCLLGMVNTDLLLLLLLDHEKFA